MSGMFCDPHNILENVHLINNRAFTTLKQSEQSLRSQYDDLASQFHGFPTNNTSTTLNQPNDPSLAADFAHAADIPQRSTSSSLLKKSLRSTAPAASPKSVRFSDSPHVAD